VFVVDDDISVGESLELLSRRGCYRYQPARSLDDVPSREDDRA
jgi:hypothetical protein